MTRLRIAACALGLAFAAGTYARAWWEGREMLTPCGPTVPEHERCPDPLCRLFCAGSHTHRGGWGTR